MNKQETEELIEAIDALLSEISAFQVEQLQIGNVVVAEIESNWLANPEN